MENISNSVLLERPDYTKHNLSQETKTTANLGQLVPILTLEVVPGDKIDLNAEFLTKFQPLETPAFQNFDAYIHYFYMPFRAMWKNWKYFIAQVPAPLASVPPLHPTFKIIDIDHLLHGFGAGVAGHHNLAPYFGINQLRVDGEVDVNPFPFIMYQHIYNEYYRHEKIHDDINPHIQLTDGLNTFTPNYHNLIRYRTYKDDYFTSALYSPQMGSPATMEVIGVDELPVYRNDTSAVSVYDKLASTHVTGGAATNTYVKNRLATLSGIQPSDTYVDMSALSATISMNDLIELNRMQEFLVRSNLAGTRYNEFIKANFGVNIPDLRLDRPDYITGLKAPVVVSELLNTGNAQGTQTGQASSYAEGGRADYTVQEHGIIMGIYSCIPRQSYVNAVPKLMFKNEAMDYFLPVFDGMGEQEIKNIELNIAHIAPNDTFGYVPRYAEYRLPFNMVTGEFTANLTTWHLSNMLPTNVLLDEAFFDIYYPDRVFAVSHTLADSLLIQVYNHIYITRPMNKYSSPVLSNNRNNFI